MVAGQGAGRGLSHRGYGMSLQEDETPEGLPEPSAERWSVNAMGDPLHFAGMESENAR